MTCPTCGVNFGERHGPECLRTLNAPKRKVRLRAKWPMISDAMAVNVKQLELARRKDKALGVPATDYKIGKYTAKPVFTSERHKREFIHRHGFHDNNSFS